MATKARELIIVDRTGQANGDLVGPDRVWARGTLADQPDGEVRLQPQVYAAAG